MPITELVFMACPAFVSRVRSLTLCDIYLTRNDFDEANAITIDLTRNVLTTAWDNVEVDAHVAADPPGLTSIGPTFHIGSHKGVVYLEMAAYAQLRATGKLASWPPPEDQAYQYQNVVRRSTSGKQDRFHGFGAQVLTAIGSVAKVALSAVGTSTPQCVLWLDLADSTTCDPPAKGFTTVVPAEGSTGALFLSWDTVRANLIEVPKLPPGEGFGTLPARGNT
jgi:hypothetical protein